MPRSSKWKQRLCLRAKQISTLRPEAQSKGQLLGKILNSSYLKPLGKLGAETGRYSLSRGSAG
jgi:hypothetical protein